MGYTFISYSTKNQNSADAMRQLFHKNNIDTWMAPYDIPAGSKYAKEITKALKDCSCLVLILSDDAQKSTWVAKEVERAINYRKSIITVQIEEVILNDEFELYISSDQVVVVNKIDETSFEIKKVLAAVRVYTKEELSNKDTTRDTMIGSVAGRMLLDNRYELESIIGKGGFGVTYKAKDLQNQNAVAMKVGAPTEQNFVTVKVGNCSKTSIVDLHRFLMNIENENLCKIYDANRNQYGETYIVSEWFEDGKPLSSFASYKECYEKLGDDYPLGAHIFVLIDVLKGLDTLHKNNIVHADIQPSNILTNGYITKLVDYSSAFFIGDGPNADGTHTVVIGDYYSPEYCETIDFRSDLYSVGMVAFKWLTGIVPEKDVNGECVLDDIDIDKEILSVLKKATAYNPEHRYQTAVEFIEALEWYLEGFLQSCYSID